MYTVIRLKSKGGVVMGLFILFGGILILGIILIRTAGRYAYTQKGLGTGFIVLGTMSLVCLLSVLISIPFQNEEYKVRYAEDRAYIESVYLNTSLSENERGEVTTLIRGKNQTINKNKIWRDSFWVGIYYPHDVGDLETFDVSKVPQAIPAYSIDVK